MSERRMSSEARKVCKCLILFAAILAWPLEIRCQDKPPEAGQVIAGNLFLEETLKDSDNSGLKTQRSSERVGDIFCKSKIIRGRVIISNRDLGDLAISETTFENAVHFFQCTFKKTVNIADSNFLEGISFTNCSFEDRVNFIGNLIGVKFQDERTAKQVSGFSGCSFAKRLRMTRTEVFSTAQFSECQFLGDVFFGDYPPNELQDFLEGIQDDEISKTVFKESTDFTRSVFKARAFFPYTEFCEVKFSDVTFEGPVRFSKAKFEGNSDFSRAIFEMRVDFERALFYPYQDKIKRPILKDMANTANFYKATFKDDVSFSKSTFLTNADFKRASFAERVVLTNAFFAERADFEMCFFGRELLASMMNDQRRIISELIFFQMNKNFENATDPKTEADWNSRYTKWEALEHKDRISRKTKDDIRRYMNERWRVDAESVGILDAFWVGADDLAKAIKDHWGKELYIDQKCFEILDAAGKSLTVEGNRSTFNGSHFGGEVDFRKARFGVADFNSGEAVTVFSGSVDLSDVFVMKEVHLDGTVFLGKLNLPLGSFFRSSGFVSNGVTLWPWKSFVAEGDVLKSESSQTLMKVYEQLEPLFRQYSQISEANEMAVRGSWERLKRGGDLLDLAQSLFTFVALPIKNLFLMMIMLNLYFYLCLTVRRSIFGRVQERKFEPGRMPILYIPDEESRVSTGAGTAEIVEQIGRWQRERFTWPLFVCLGTFFALFSLGSKYVTKDTRCLRNMKILRAAGFVLLPLFIYSLAKRSEGLHKIFTLL